MRISNFELTRVDGENALDWVAHATVDVKKFMRKKVNVSITREYGSLWFFDETGQWTPFFDIEPLARKWETENGLIFKRK